MTLSDVTLGIVGGSGQLGSAILRRLLDRGISDDQIWVANRSGSLDGFENHSGIHVTPEAWELAADCDVILLAIPPDQTASLQFDASHALVLSVMAGITLEQITTLTGAKRAVRAICNPAAEFGLAYSPWVAAPSVSAEDKTLVQSLFETLGKTDELPDETQIDLLTAISAPVPGFVAQFAAAMSSYGESRGLPAAISDRATRQLFLAAGHVMSDGTATPADHVTDMIDYDGTTAAGLQLLNRSGLSADIADALDAAVDRTRSIAT